MANRKLWQLDKIQRKCQALCFGPPATSGIKALEVEAGIMPLDLSRQVGA